MSLSSHCSFSALLWVLRKRQYPPGTMFYVYLVLAGSMRFIVEFWRANPIVGLGMTEYQWISLALVALGLLQVLRPRRMELASLPIIALEVNT